MIKKRQTDNNPYTFVDLKKEYYYVVGQDDKQNDEVGQGYQQNAKFG